MACDMAMSRTYRTGGEGIGWGGKGGEGEAGACPPDSGGSGGPGPTPPTLSGLPSRGETRSRTDGANIGVYQCRGVPVWAAVRLGTIESAGCLAAVRDREWKSMALCCSLRGGRLGAAEP